MWSREPLAPFFLIGLVMFGVEIIWRDNPIVEQPESDVFEIQVSSSQLKELRDELRRALGREPSEERFAAAVRTWLKEEMLVREARSLELDTHDTTIRRRLAQKMVLLMQSMEVPPEPSEQDLRSHFAMNSEVYRVATKVTFRHIFVGADEALADAIHERWLSGEDPRQLTELALAPPGGPVLRGRSPSSLNERFGTVFTTRLLGLSSTPEVLQSTLGYHVVRIESKQEGRSLSFEEAKDRVRTAWRTQWLRTATETATEQLETRYQVVGWP